MLRKQATELTKKDCLIQLKNECVMKLASLEVDIEVFKSMPPDTIIGDKPLSKIIGGIQGRQAINAKEYLKYLDSEVFKTTQRLDSVNKLISVL